MDGILRLLVFLLLPMVHVNSAVLPLNTSPPLPIPHPSLRALTKMGERVRLCNSRHRLVYMLALRLRKRSGMEHSRKMRRHERM